MDKDALLYTTTLPTPGPIPEPGGGGLDDIGKALCAASKWLEANNWCRRHVHFDNTTSCAIGALNRVGVDLRDYQLLDAMAQRMGFSNHHGLVAWNDVYCDSKETLINKFRDGVAKSCREWNWSTRRWEGNR